jgi:SecD/SecF fusion protein
MVAVDESVPSYEDRNRWADVLAKPELDLASRALQSEKSLRKVVQFAPVVAATARNQAFQAILLSFAAIAVYVWFRFGTLQFGLAAVVALVHDVAVPLALLSLFDLLGIASFRIDMAIVAALMTLIGYGLNDTIVIFDRIRENRGKLTKLSAGLINDSLNQTLSRTILTSWNVFITVAILFVLGGPGVRGFAFVMLVGTLSSTYTTLAIAVPLVYQPKLLHMVVYVLTALMLFGLVVMLGAQALLLGVVGAVILAALIGAIVIESKSDRGALVAAG